jgi:hypothetical protein
VTVSDQAGDYLHEPPKGAWASSIGRALEYYDFALYSLASALIFGRLFFPSSDPAVGLLASFGIYFLGFAVRPVGGAFFGILGDKLGRKFVLLEHSYLDGTRLEQTGLGKRFFGLVACEGPRPDLLPTPERRLKSFRCRFKNIAFRRSARGRKI